MADDRERVVARADNDNRQRDHRHVGIKRDCYPCGKNKEPSDQGVSNGDRGTKRSDYWNDLFIMGPVGAITIRTGTNTCTITRKGR